MCRPCRLQGALRVLGVGRGERLGCGPAHLLRFSICQLRWESRCFQVWRLSGEPFQDQEVGAEPLACPHRVPQLVSSEHGTRRPWETRLHHALMCAHIHSLTHSHTFTLAHTCSLTHSFTHIQICSHIQCSHTLTYAHIYLHTPMHILTLSHTLTSTAPLPVFLKHL